MAHRRTGAVDRIVIAVGGLLPFAGVVFLDWSIATAIFFAWADAVLGALRLVPAVVVEDYEQGNPKLPLLEFPFLVAGALVGWGLFFLPFFLLGGAALDGLVVEFEPGGLLAVAEHMIFVEPWWLALLALARLVQCAFDLLEATATGKGTFMEVVTTQGALLLLKGVAVAGLAGLAYRFLALGPGVVLAFLGVASVLLVWMESRAADWFYPEKESLSDGPRVRISDVRER